MGVFEWRLSDKTKKANAALAGIGQTRRIIISDTLLAEHSDDEIEVILAHELAHHVHRDIWKGIALETVTDRARLLPGGPRAHAVCRLVRAGWGRAMSRRCRCLLLAAGAVSLALMPLANALLARARAARRPLRARDDEERSGVRERDETPRLRRTSPRSTRRDWCRFSSTRTRRSATASKRRTRGPPGARRRSSYDGEDTEGTEGTEDTEGTREASAFIFSVVDRSCSCATSS